MHTKPLTFLSTLLCCMLTASLQAQTIHYVRAGWSGDGSAWFNASGNLQAMINASAAGDFVYVAAGTYQPGAPSYTFTMKEGVKIYGGFDASGFGIRNITTNVTILKGNSFSVIRNYSGITPASELDGFTISDGTTFQGAGMYNEYASPTVANCTFTGNFADQGAGMYNFFASPVIRNCRFTGNRAFYYGGGIYNTFSAPVITGCIFTANKSLSSLNGGGGGMYNTNSSQPTISVCAFTKDTATLYGGAILNDVFARPNITNCSFEENVAQYGGAISNLAGTASIITNCIIRLNRASGFGSGFGGGLYNEQSNTIARSSRIYANVANNGAGIYSLNGDNVTIASCLITDNISVNYGGGLYTIGSSPIIDGCTFTRNNAQLGGTIYNDAGGNPSLSNCIIWNNFTAPIINNGGSPVVTYSIVQGGYAGTGNLNIDPLFLNPDNDFRVQYCSPAYNAGNYTLVPGDNTTDVAGKPRIIGATVDMGAYENNTVMAGAGNIVYVNQSASGDGSSWGFATTNLSAAMLLAKGTVSIYTAANPLKIFVAKGTYKPGFRVDDPCASGRENTFLIWNNVLVYGGFDPANGIDDLTDTRITGAGGSILSGDIGVINDNSDNCYHVVGTSGMGDTARLDGFTVTGGNANAASGSTTFGGGIFITGSDPVIANCSIIGNSGHFGAGIFNNNATSSIINCTISGNTAISYGGGVYNSGLAPSFTNCSFTGNGTVNGTGGGGAIFNNSSTPAITNCTFSSNTGDYGGAIYNFAASAPVLSGCTFTSNAASANGGGIYSVNTSSSTLTRCTFWMNTAVFGGGALFNGGAANAVNCHFSGNTANSYGGAVYNNGQSRSYTNCTFYGNVAVNPTGGGGGMFTYTGSPLLVNCTFRGNFGDIGGAVRNFPSSSFNMFNSIVWGNNSNNTASIYNDAGAFSSVHYCDVQGGYTGTGNLNTDPLFVNATLGAGSDGIWGTTDDGLRLQACSPVANMGNSSIVQSQITTDASAIPRIQFSSVDMGAYENNSLADVAAANIVAANAVSNAWQIPNGQTFYGPDCSTLAAAITGDGTATSIRGNTTVKVWIEPSQPADIVKRHYEITPQDVNPNTATANITLYFTQAEFDAFNAVNALKLPQGPADAAGKANLRIEKRSASTTTINPDDANINWNAARSRWEVSIAVTGFSGFFVKTKIFNLPLRLVSFTSTEKNCMTTLQWVTADETNVAHFEAEQSEDGIAFSTFQVIPARNTANENKYVVTVPVSNKTMFYRLKMVDIDGRFNYAPVSVISSTCANKVMLHPNPAKDKLFIRNASAGSMYAVYDNTGKKVSAGRISKSIEEVYISGIVPGLYYIIISGDKGVSNKLRFVKE